MEEMRTELSKISNLNVGILNENDNLKEKLSFVQIENDKLIQEKNNFENVLRN